MKKLNKEEISKVMDILIGEVDAVGETYEDIKRLENLDALIFLTDRCLDKIAFAARTSTRTEASMRRIGREALKYLAESAEWFNQKKRIWRNQEGVNE